MSGQRLRQDQSPAPDGRATPQTFSEMLRHLDWRQELLALFIVLAESALVFLACAFALPDSTAAERAMPAWIVVMLLLSAHFIPHLLDEWRIWSPDYEVIVGASIVVTLLIAVKFASFPGIALWDTDWIRQAARAVSLLPNDAIRPVWAIVMLGAYAWWRGRTRAPAGIDSAYSMLRMGILVLALILVVILAGTDDDADVRGKLSLGTIAFFVAALSAVGAARLKLEGFRTSAPLGPRWLATFVGPILAVVVVAIIGAGIFSRQFLDTTLWMLSPVFWVLTLVFQAFVLLMAIIAFIILSPIVWLIGTREPTLVAVTPTTTTGGDPSLAERTGDAPFQVPDPLRYLIAALILFAIFSLLTRFVFRRRRRERTPTDEERESVLEWGDMFGALGTRLRGLLQRRPPAADPLAHLRGDERWKHTLAIRETYGRLQSRGAQAGRPRRVSETADEYRPGVTQVIPVPDGPAEVATITDHYDRARYSGVPATADDASAVSAAWQHIERGTR